MSKLIELEQKLQAIQGEIDALKKVETRTDKAKSWDRVDRGYEHWVIGGISVGNTTDDNGNTDDELYEIANYNTDKSYMERIKLEQDLWRKLKRFADQNNEGEIYWGDGKQDKYEICFEHSRHDIRAYPCRQSQYFGQAHFTSKEIAEKAIETFKTELLEYFGA